MCKSTSVSSSSALHHNKDFKQTAASELAERVQLFQQQSKAVVELNCRGSDLRQRLGTVLSDALIVGIDHRQQTRLVGAEDSTLSSIHTIAADTDTLPIASDSVDLVVSNLSETLKASHDSVSECYRILVDGGVLMFSAIAPDSFVQFKSAAKDLEDIRFIGDFHSVHQFGDLLLVAGFTDPVVDVERWDFEYTGLATIAEQLFRSGFAHELFDCPQWLEDRQNQQLFVENYPDDSKNGDTLRISLEVLFAVAWKKSSRLASATVRFQGH